MATSGILRPGVREFELLLIVELAVLIGLVGFAVLAVVLYLQRRGESRRALQARLAELQLLSDAVRDIAAAALDEDELINLVYECARRMVDVSNFQLGLFDGSHYAIRLRFADGACQPEARFDLSETGGIVGWVRESGQALLVRDFESEMDCLPAQPRWGWSAWARAWG